MTPTIIYITGFRQHAGKTVVCLGLLSMLSKIISPEKLGYLKPVGQELVTLSDGSKVDKDAKIIERFGGIPDLDMNYVSPVRLGSGFTKDFLDSSDMIADSRMLQDSITTAVKALAGKQIIIAEGTGHPGVGSIVGLSNANVANQIGAEIIFLSDGGIGKALDTLEVDLSYFLFKKSRVRGVIFNRLIPDKIPTLKQYITEKLLNQRFGSIGGHLRILGFLPQIDTMANPSMRVIVDFFRGSKIIGNVENPEWTTPCSSIVVITLPDEMFVPHEHIHPDCLVIIAACSSFRIKKIIEYNQRLKAESGRGMGGFLLSCGIEHSVGSEISDLLEANNIPCLLISKDSATAEAELIKAFENTKLQLFDNLKINAIEKLFEEYFDMQKFLDSFNIKI